MSEIIKEQLAVVGGNASGKSIVAQQIAGRENVRYITFRDSYGYNGDRSFFMQQRWNLFTVDTFTPDAGEVLRQAADACPDSESANARLKELISLFGLEPLLDKLLVTLSSGELRKFQLTKALISQPKTLVIDNPYIGLDPVARKVLTRLLTTLAEEGLMSIILILAREEEIPPFITHIL
ncbi:MAG: ATP-binding cassette domain-containing protein, partial [Bacteroidales bacterium]|nr:ATP-binding cassette domain-containing protein [Bacteroidales bacterium]